MTFIFTKVIFHKDIFTFAQISLLGTLYKTASLLPLQYNELIYRVQTTMLVLDVCNYNISLG